MLQISLNPLLRYTGAVSPELRHYICMIRDCIVLYRVKELYIIPSCATMYTRERDFPELYVKNQLRSSFANGSHVELMMYVFGLKVNNKLHKNNFKTRIV